MVRWRSLLFQRGALDLLLLVGLLLLRVLRFCDFFSTWLRIRRSCGGGVVLLFDVAGRSSRVTLSGATSGLNELIIIFATPVFFFDIFLFIFTVGGTGKILLLRWCLTLG